MIDAITPLSVNSPGQIAVLNTIQLSGNTMWFLWGLTAWVLSALYLMRKHRR